MNAHQEIASDQTAGDTEIYTLCGEVLPVWANQIEAARKITNSAIEDLSARFSSLSQRIESVTQHTQGSGQTELLSLLHQSQDELEHVTDLLKSNMQEKLTLIKAITSMAEYAHELRGMADTVTRIAKETNMVAVNAAIEAAHVGEKGRGFAVVAEAVRRLSNDAARTGSNISQKVLNVTDAIQEVTSLSEEFEVKDRELIESAENTVKKVIMNFGDAAQNLVESSEKMLSENQHVSHEISNVLVSLQFQDRVSQMLSHVSQNINKLNSQILSGYELDTSTWMEALRATYTTAEQHLIHSGKAFDTNKSSQIQRRQIQSAPSADEITFF